MSILQAKNRIIIIGHTLRFPNGMGASARMANYASGLSALGNCVTVLCLKAYEPAGGPVLNPNQQGTFCGAEYYYTCGTSIVAKEKWKRLIQNLRGLAGAMKYFLPLFRSKNIEAVLYYDIGESIFYTFFGWLLSRWVGAPFVGEITEQPYIYCKASKTTQVKKFIFWKFVVKFFDGMVVISKHLKRLFQLSVRKNVSIELIPVVVDVNRFDHQDLPESHTVAFVGSLGHEEEIDSLLRIWAQVWPQFKNYTLAMVGDITTAREKNLQNRADALGIGTAVSFPGMIARDKVPEILRNSAALVLPRPSGLFSTAGLPNKLGEYLASGRPVICNSVGDIPFYLKDKENAFLVDPEDPQQFVDRLCEILSNPEQARLVGMEGRRVAENVFGLEMNCRRITKYFRLLNSKSRAE